MIIDIKFKGDFDRILESWGIPFYRETKKAIEVYTFKWGVAHRYVWSKKGVEEKEVEKFRIHLLQRKAIEINSITEV